MKNAPNASAQRRTIIMRTAAAAAACAVFAAGMLAYNGNRDNKLDEQITYEAVSPNSYDELYNRYTGIPLNGEESGESIRTAITYRRWKIFPLTIFRTAAEKK